jgi:DNA polymerase III sliding clamp (beta) subunit (PCNA family)
VNDALRAIPYDEIQIEMQESIRPGIICGPDKNEFLYVVMPVSLAN